MRIQRLRPAVSLGSGRTLAGAIALALLVGCGPSRRAVEFVDLVADRSFRDAAGPVPVTQSVCWDETYDTVAIEPGTTLSARLSLGEEPALHLGGVLDCGNDFGTEDEEGLVLGKVVGADGEEAPIEIEFTGATGWWSRAVDLSRLEGERAEIELEAELPSGCVVRLKDAYVEQRRAIESQGPRPLQILLVSVDTLRGDTVDNPAIPTPNLDELASQGERWTRHYAAATWTKPSHASMLTGYAPQTHRALGLRDPIARAIPTLAERFREGGFVTGALVFDTAWLSARWGFAKGFDEYRIVRWRADREVRAAANWLIRHRNDSYFFFLHTFEPHSDHSILPYEAPGVSRRTIAADFGFSDFGCRRRLCASTFLIALDRGRIRPRPREPGILRSTYLDGVRFTDAALGALVTALEESGVWDNMLVVFTSDHGEAFGEHGHFTHSTLHEEVIHVPLIIKWPRGARAGQLNDVPSSSLDLAPTLLEYAGLSIADLPGTHLDRRTTDQPVFSGTYSIAAVLGSEKAIISRSGDVEELYDLAVDPGETRNLSGLSADGADELARMGRAWMKAAQALAGKLGAVGEGEAALSDRDQERLRAFGYLQ